MYTSSQEIVSIKRTQKIILVYGNMQIPGFVVKKRNETFIILSCNDVVDLKTGRVSIMASSDKPSNSCLGWMVKGKKSVVRVVSKDGCCVSGLNGKTIMKIVADLNKTFKVKHSWLDDHSHVTIAGHSVRLAILSLIKHGKTWYQLNGFNLTKKGQTAVACFMSLKTNDFITFIKKTAISDSPVDKDLRELIPVLIDKKVWHKKLRNTLCNILKKNIESILWFDFIFYLPKEYTGTGVGKILGGLQSSIIRHTAVLFKCT
jgi:hypothetical protein